MKSIKSNTEVETIQFYYCLQSVLACVRLNKFIKKVVKYFFMPTFIHNLAV